MSAHQSHQHALDPRVKLFGEEHQDTAHSYFYLGETQHALGNFSSALQSHQRALDIRVKLFGEEHSDTAERFMSEEHSMPHETFCQHLTPISMLLT